jgi:hypothetical protein
MTSLILIALMNTPYVPSLEFITSDDDKNVSYLIVDGKCKIKMKREDLKKADLIVQLVEEKCGYLLYSL